MTAKEHNKLVGIFLLVHGAFQALIMLFICLVYGILGSTMVATARGEERFVGLIFIAAIVFIVVLALVLVLPQVLGGWKILKEKPNARTWGIIGSIISLLSFPLGTAVGVYGLWYLFGEMGKSFYSSGSVPSNFRPPPPPPSSWQ